MPRGNVKFEGSERADREITQPQIGEAALFPDTEQRPVERLPQKIVAAPYRNADTFADVIIGAPDADLGGTDAGFFVLLYFLVHHGVARGLAWAHRGAVAGIACWFVIDSTGSALLGAGFNVALVNLPALLVLGVPLYLLRPDRYDRAAGSPGRAGEPEEGTR